jgi:hypothetical protein
LHTTVFKFVRGGPLTSTSILITARDLGTTLAHPAVPETYESSMGMTPTRLSQADHDVAALFNRASVPDVSYSLDSQSGTLPVC